MFDLTALRQAAELIGRHVPPTPQYNWPLLSQRLGCEVWVKHENHTPAGAFKVRGGLLYVHELLGREPRLPGMISATRGNHGISLAMAARQAGVPLKVLVPQGNSTEKNAAMRACGAEVIEHGEDFDTARQQAAELARQSGWHFVPALHPDLIRGVATYALELFEAAPPLRRVYVPIGMGSGICGLIRVRDLLGWTAKSSASFPAQRTHTHRASSRGGSSAPRPPIRSPMAWPAGCLLPKHWRSLPKVPHASCESMTAKSAGRSSRSTKTPTTPRRAPAPPHWLPPFRNARLTRGNALPSCSAAPTSIAVCWRGYWRATCGVPTDVCDASKAEGCLLNQETSPSPQAIPVWPAQRHTRARPAQRAPARRRPGHRSTDR